jgi:predicted nucleotidyltransferase
MSNITLKWVELLIPFTNGYNKEYTQSDLAKITKIPQQTASRYLAELVKNNYLNYKIEGKNKLFFIDLNNINAYNLFELIENYKCLKFNNKIKDASLIINELIKFSETIILFGSYSNYKYKNNSDLDLLFIGKVNKKKIKEIKEKIHITVNEHYLSFLEFEKYLKQKKPLSIEILNKHIIFGEKNKIIKLFIGEYNK